MVLNASDIWNYSLCHFTSWMAFPLNMYNFLQPMPEFNNLSLQEHGGGGGVADDPYGTHSSRPSFYGGCGYSREYWRNLAGPDYHRGGGAKLSPGSVPRHGPSSPRHASPGRRVKILDSRTIKKCCKKLTFQPILLSTQEPSLCCKHCQRHNGPRV